MFLVSIISFQRARCFVGKFMKHEDVHVIAGLTNIMS